MNEKTDHLTNKRRQQLLGAWDGLLGLGLRVKLWCTLLVGALVLQGCSPQGADGVESASEPTAHFPKHIEVVDAGTYFSNVPAYAGREVYLYLNRVNASLLKTESSQMVMSRDGRDVSKYGYLELSNRAVKKWQSIGLDSKKKYTITFKVKATDHCNGCGFMYRIEADDFVVHTEGDARYPAKVTLGANGLPVERLTFPRPITVTDLKQLELFPEQYKDRSIRVQLTFVTSQIQPHNDDYLEMEEIGKLKVLMKKDVIRNKLAGLPTVATVEITGKLETSGGASLLMGDKLDVWE